MMASERYRRNPLILNRNRNSNFQSLVAKIKCKIMSWQIPLLSQAGRSTLIKSAASAIPIYNMFVLQHPSRTIATVDKMFRNSFGATLPGKKKKVFTQLSGKKFISLSKMQGWGSGTPKRTIQLFWLRLVGNALLIEDRLSSQILELNIV